MPNTYSQVYLQFVFAVCSRQALIYKNIKEEIQKYLTGLAENRKAKMLAVNCMPDHTHMFIGYKPTIYIPDFVKELKVESNEFINHKKLTDRKFGWQDGYGVFSYSHSQIDTVIKYVLNQEVHHQKKTFRQEYHQLLKSFDISFDDKYLFNFFD